MKLRKRLEQMFEQLDKQFTGYSNAASIERHAKEAGASACTDVSKLSMQDLKTDAVWMWDKIKMVCTEYEVALLILNYGQGFSLHSAALAYLKLDTEHFKYNSDLIDIYAQVPNAPKLKEIAIKNDVSYKTVLIARNKLFKQLEKDLLLAEKLIEKELA